MKMTLQGVSFAAISILFLIIAFQAIVIVRTTVTNNMFDNMDRKFDDLLPMIHKYQLPKKAVNSKDLGHGWLTFELDSNKFLYHIGGRYMSGKEDKMECITQIK